MTAYVIHGEYPTYTITADGEEFDRSSNMGAIMGMFTHRIEPGDSITWEIASQEAR